MSYKVLARTYRPAQFVDLVGQEVVGRTLANAVKRDQVHHAYLFCGPRGVGKTSAARILAKALNCEEGPTPTPCNKCSACLEISAGHSMDVQEIDGASHNGVDHVRELQETARIRPARRCRVFIIDEVHMLTNQAFNALLKLLEEPPERVHFIFATTEPHKVIETIRSRCQRHDFRRIPSRQIVDALNRICTQEDISTEVDALRVVAGAADGGMRDALSLLEQALAYVEGSLSAELAAECLGVVDRNQVLDLLTQLRDGERAEALMAIDKLHQRGGDLARFADALVEELRNLCLVREVESAAELLQLDDEAYGQLHQLAQALDPNVLRRWFRIALTAADEVARSGHPRSLLEVMILRMAASQDAQPLEELLSQLSGMRSPPEVNERRPPSKSAVQTSPPVRPKPRSTRPTKAPDGIDQRIQRFLQSVHRTSPPLAATLSLAGLHIEADEIRGRVSEDLHKILRQETSRRDVSRALSEFTLRGLRIGALFVEPSQGTGEDLFDTVQPDSTSPKTTETGQPDSNPSEAGTTAKSQTTVSSVRPPAEQSGPDVSEESPPKPPSAERLSGTEEKSSPSPARPTQLGGATATVPAPESLERPSIGLFSAAPEDGLEDVRETQGSVLSPDGDLGAKWLAVVPQLPEGLFGQLVSFAPLALEDGQLLLVSETEGLVQQVRGRLPTNLSGEVTSLTVRVAQPHEVELVRTQLQSLRRSQDPEYRKQMELREHETTQAILDLFGARIEESP